MIDRVLVVEDQAAVRHALAVELGRANFEVSEAGDGLEGWQKFCCHRPDLVITDLLMPRGDGQQLLQRITAESNVPVLLYSSCATVRSAVDAIRGGAVDFLSAADSSIEQIVARAKGAIQSHRSVRGASPQSADRARSHMAVLRERLVGDSAAMVRLRRRLLVLVPLRIPVLLVGVPGTAPDKDAVVQVLHDLDLTRNQKLHTVYCSANPAAIASDLNLADNANCAVYLRDVERLSTAAQVDWSRRLACWQERGPRVFASSTLPAVWLTGSLNPSGLYDGLRKYLSPNLLRLPTLEERPGDLPELTRTLIADFARIAGRKISLSRSATIWLEERDWPGQTAQLGQLLGRAVAFTPGREIQTALLEEIQSENELSVVRLRDEQGRRDREQLVATMRTTGGNIKRTAEILGKSRPAIYRLLKKYQM